MPRGLSVIADGVVLCEGICGHIGGDRIGKGITLRVLAGGDCIGKGIKLRALAGPAAGRS